ncbi:Phosphohistidine phosphatase, SixA [Desulfosarcina cetonica]|uniref:phosphohistidine phosphatase SixA n=1 Tax=Desulfosarcina cetonica TaxID=90730 RepID=UPI0006D0B5A1|nr:phosphohistidine phosphatase SixA [Desulfosarcina cetonica]VTR64933.1 Phosphohistidine phosphatase, SixA [Desulfosarcina cetonica]
MALYVVQHGKSLTKDQDPQKGLSTEGVADTERIADVAAGYRVPVQRILHSGKKRARQTAEILFQKLSPPDGMDLCEGMNPLDDVRAFAQQIDLNQNSMLVGHLPFMERMLGFLICGNPDQIVFKLQNSGIVCVDRVDGVENPVIRWALMPMIGGGPPR